LDSIQTNFDKSLNLWGSLTEDDLKLNPQWINPKQSTIDSRQFLEILQNHNLIEFGKQFFYKNTIQIPFNQRPQPSFNKDFDLLIHNLLDNQSQKIDNFIFSDSNKQIERIYSILNDIQKGGEFTPIYNSLRQGFSDLDVKMALYTDHQIFDRYYKYRRKKGYEKTQAISLKELKDLKPGDYITHIDHGIGKYAGLEKIEVNGKSQEMIR